MVSPGFGLPPQLFAEVFPFHLVFDQDTKIVQIGDVLQRICPELTVGSEFEQHFLINRPNIPIEFEAIKERSHSLFLLKSRHNEMQLKGQMVYVEESEVLVFLGSPWITNITELDPFGLKLRDFAIHDPVADYLFLLQAQNAALSDAKKLTNKLTDQRAEIRKALEKEKQLSELKSRFVTMTSHEFRTPLSTILSSAELLEHYSHKWSEEKKLTHLQRIQTAVKQMTQLLNDVLLIGKAEAGKLEFNPVPLDVAKFCRELVEELQLNTHNKHLLAFVTECQSLNACIDEKLLRRILTNLLSNAIKYSPEGSTVYFELGSEDEQIIFHIQDEGIGIPQEDLGLLFEPFHRAKNVGTISGTGLGLTIVKKSVDLQSGKIAVNSELGMGSTFTVTLPLNKQVSSK